MYYCFLCKASHEMISTDESNYISKIHACTGMIQTDFNIQPLSLLVTILHSNFIQVLTWYNDYNVMLRSEI